MITLDSLKSDKAYQKLLKKHQKDVEDLEKKHLKEKNAILRVQCAAMDKAIADEDKQRINGEKSFKKKGYIWDIFCVIPLI